MSTMRIFYHDGTVDMTECSFYSTMQSSQHRVQTTILGSLVQINVVTVMHVMHLLQISVMVLVHPMLMIHVLTILYMLSVLCR